MLEVWLKGVNAIGEVGVGGHWRKSKREMGEGGCMFGGGKVKRKGEGGGGVRGWWEKIRKEKRKKK
jgi:hypothetical protein